MNTLKKIILSTVCGLALAVSAAEPLPTVAVFNFESGDDKALGAKVATMITALLSAEPELVTVERAELEKLLGEQELGLSGTVSADTAAKVGNLTGAKVLITGRVFKVDNDMIMVAKIIGTETSRVYGELAKGKASASISDLSAELAQKIAKTVTTKASTLIAKVETREERLAKIKKALGEGKRPTVSVKLPERHFGAPVIDPAAETELLLILKECGFGITDDKSKEPADLEITGEAFSAYALRKGNLISCKARIEIKVHDHKTTNLLLAERQTSVAVDVTEQTSAKTALQNAAMELAERLLPKLVGK